MSFCAKGGDPGLVPTKFAVKVVNWGKNKDNLMQERNSGPGPTGPDGSEQINQFDTLARNMVRLFDQGTKVILDAG